MSDDLHTPTSAAPDPGAAAWQQPADSPPAVEDERPEVLVGAAFAGGLVAAMILKRFGRRG